MTAKTAFVVFTYLFMYLLKRICVLPIFPHLHPKKDRMYNVHANYAAGSKIQVNDILAKNNEKYSYLRIHLKISQISEKKARPQPSHRITLNPLVLTLCCNCISTPSATSLTGLASLSSLKSPQIL